MGQPNSICTNHGDCTAPSRLPEVQTYETRVLKQGWAPWKRRFFVEDVLNFAEFHKCCPPGVDTCRKSKGPRDAFVPVRKGLSWPNIPYQAVGGGLSLEIVLRGNMLVISPTRVKKGKTYTRQALLLKAFQTHSLFFFLCNLWIGEGEAKYQNTLLHTFPMDILQYSQWPTRI